MPADRPRPLPQVSQMPQATASALALVCTLPESGYDGRSTNIRSVIRQATESRESEDGIVFVFPDTDTIGRSLFELVLAERQCCAQFRYSIVFRPTQQRIELQIETSGPLVQPLKELYRSLGAENEGGAGAEADGRRRTHYRRSQS